MLRPFRNKDMTYFRNGRSVLRPYKIGARGPSHKKE